MIQEAFRKWLGSSQGSGSVEGVFRKCSGNIHQVFGK